MAIPGVASNVVFVIDVSETTETLALPENTLGATTVSWSLRAHAVQSVLSYARILHNFHADNKVSVLLCADQNTTVVNTWDPVQQSISAILAGLKEHSPRSPAKVGSAFDVSTALKEAIHVLRSAPSRASRDHTQPPAEPHPAAFSPLGHSKDTISSLFHLSTNSGGADRHGGTAQNHLGALESTASHVFLLTGRPRVADSERTCALDALTSAMETVLAEADN
ncbi:hypothetical protein CYMTET_44037, partial [Cymbomonas tetramitiformis]